MKTIADIQAIRDKMKSQIVVRDKDTSDEIRVIVGMATCGISAGARQPSPVCPTVRIPTSQTLRRRCGTALGSPSTRTH